MTTITNKDSIHKTNHDLESVGKESTLFMSPEVSQDKSLNHFGVMTPQIRLLASNKIQSKSLESNREVHRKRYAEKYSSSIPRFDPHKHQERQDEKKQKMVDLLVQ